MRVHRLALRVYGGCTRRGRVSYCPRNHVEQSQQVGLHRGRVSAPPERPSPELPLSGLRGLTLIVIYSWAGLACGIIAWLVTTSTLNDGVVSIETTSGDYPM